MFFEFLFSRLRSLNLFYIHILMKSAEFHLFRVKKTSHVSSINTPRETIIKEFQIKNILSKSLSKSCIESAAQNIYQNR